MLKELPKHFATKFAGARFQIRKRNVPHMITTVVPEQLLSIEAKYNVSNIRAKIMFDVERCLQNVMVDLHGLPGCNHIKGAN